MCRRNHRRESRRRFVLVKHRPRRRAHGNHRARNAAKHRRNQHHIYCQQRFPELRRASRNIVDVNVIKHDRYHWLFQNRTPEEIIDYLINYFWGGYIPATIKIQNKTSKEIADYLRDYFEGEHAPSTIQICAFSATEAVG